MDLFIVVTSVAGVRRFESGKNQRSWSSESRKVKKWVPCHLTPDFSF
jgi:hypothetical protein